MDFRKPEEHNPSDKRYGLYLRSYYTWLYIVSETYNTFKIYIGFTTIIKRIKDIDVGIPLLLFMRIDRQHLVNTGSISQIETGVTIMTRMDTNITIVIEIKHDWIIIRT